MLRERPKGPSGTGHLSPEHFVSPCKETQKRPLLVDRVQIRFMWSKSNLIQSSDSSEATSSEKSVDPVLHRMSAVTASIASAASVTAPDSSHLECAEAPRASQYSLLSHFKEVENLWTRVCPSCVFITKTDSTVALMQLKFSDAIQSVTVRSRDGNTKNGFLRELVHQTQEEPTSRACGRWSQEVCSALSCTQAVGIGRFNNKHTFSSWNMVFGHPSFKQHLRFFCPGQAHSWSWFLWKFNFKGLTHS